MKFNTESKGLQKRIFMSDVDIKMGQSNRDKKAPFQPETAPVSHDMDSD